MDDRKVFRLDDNVLRRIVQIVQEGMLTGTDVADHMRLLNLEEGSEPGVLVLTEEYKAYVESTHERLLAFAEEVKASAAD
jgi:hypothetical protein